jgi:hypothetical protein
MPPLRMVQLFRSASAWSARKAIPADARDAYKRLYGQGHEAKFYLKAEASPVEAKARFAEWLSEVESRIANIRASQAGEALQLSHREARVSGIAGLSRSTKRSPVGNFRERERDDGKAPTLRRGTHAGSGVSCGAGHPPSTGSPRAVPSACRGGLLCGEVNAGKVEAGHPVNSRLSGA